MAPVRVIDLRQRLCAGRRSADCQAIEVLPERAAQPVLAQHSERTPSEADAETGHNPSRLVHGALPDSLDYPIAKVSDAFSSPANWCDALILHLNVKYCRPASRDGRAVLSTAIGRNFDQPMSSAHRVEFTFGIAAPRPDHVDVELKARKGPLDTANYRISLEAVGLGSKRTFVHLRGTHRRHAGRTHITVLDRPRREQMSCECYAVVKRETDRLLPYVPRRTGVENA